MVENDWLSDFDVTTTDMQRMEDWLKEQKRGVTLEELTRRIISGRVRHGQDKSPSALPGWIQEKHVLSWNEQEKWCLGCQVLVAKTTYGKVIPVFGVIVKITQNTYFIDINGEDQKYVREPIGSRKTQTFYEYVLKAIWEQEQIGTASIEDQINIVLLKQGAEIASRIRGALDRDDRFTNHINSWYLQKWIPVISTKELQQAHHQILKTTKQASLSNLRDLIPNLPKDILGEIAILQALSKAPDLFQPCHIGWQAVKPPPPSWDKAVGTYYVYDPKTYEIILKPSERLRKKVADRLIELGFYAEVVEAAEN